MSLRRLVCAVSDVTLRALESGISFLLLKLEVQYPLVSRLDVAAGAFSSTRFHLRSRFWIQRVQCRNRVTSNAAQTRVGDPLVTELNSLAFAPLLQSDSVIYSHRRRKFGIELIVSLCQLYLPRRWQKFVARTTVGRRGLKTVLSMACEAYGVRRGGLERSLLQPERILR